MSEKVMFNINQFVKGSPEEKKLTIPIEPTVIDSEPKKKRGRKKSNEKESVALAPPVPQTSMSYIQENIPYAIAYQETNKQLDDAINQLNVLGADIMIQLQNVAASKTLKNKYGYINDMTNTCSSIISAKIAAIKEKNKTINDVNHLELSRLKELKNKANEEDDNTRIANMYNAFVNTPMNVGRVGSLAPSMQDLMLADTVFPQQSIGIQSSMDQVAWEQSLNPAQNRMILEAKGAIETVVMYDNATGNRWYEVVDKTTRQPVPNVEKPDPTNIYDIDINVRGGFAKDSMRNVVYPLIVLNSEEENNVINQY